MARKVSRHSIFSQRLDRAVFTAYFVGGIVPLIALVVVVNEWVLPAVDAESARLAWVAGLISLGVLSLSLYAALRHITKTALARMDSDNRRLHILLSTSSELSEENHFEAILGTTAARVREVSGSDQLAIYYSPRADKPLELHSSTDEAGSKWVAKKTRKISVLNEEALSTGEPAMGSSGIVAVPFVRSSGPRGSIVWKGGDAAEPDTIDAIATIAGIAGTAIERGDLHDAQRNFFAHVTDLIVTALDAHVVGRQGHAMQTARLCNRLANEVGLDSERKERLHWGALLHDIGMLKIPPGRHLDPKAVHLHPVVGARMLERIRLWEPVAPLVLRHHEWFDGSGYPEGLAGEEIPLEARIIALADAADAMSRGDAQREGKSLPEIVDELALGQGTQFDPALVEAFKGLAEKGEIQL